MLARSFPKGDRISIFFTAIILPASTSKALITRPFAPEPIVPSSFHFNKFPFSYFFKKINEFYFSIRKKVFTSFLGSCVASSKLKLIMKGDSIKFFFNSSFFFLSNNDSLETDFEIWL